MATTPAIDPYRIFFPIGLLNALLAVGVWFIRDLGWLDVPAMLIHGKLVAGGFLWAFIVGFLMTAIPRMTGTAPATKFEFAVPLALFLTIMVTAWMIDPRPFYFTHLLLVLFLISFVARRHITSAKGGPVFLSHIGLAMLLALGGDVYHIAGYGVLGMYLLQVGAVLLLVLGIGTRFFSFLSGLPTVFESSTARWPRIAFHLSGVVAALLLYAAGRGITLSYLGLGVLSLVYMFMFWRVQRHSARKGAVRYAMIVVASTIPTAFFLSWLFPALHITWMHILFIGCFTMITFAVATRVALSHGGFGVDIELTSKSLWWVIALFVAALIMRELYGLTTDVWWQKSWMHTAAGFWVAAVTVYCTVFLKRIINIRRS